MRRQLLYMASVLSSLVLFILRFVFADFGEHMLYNIEYLVLKFCKQTVLSKGQIFLIQ